MALIDNDANGGGVGDEEKKAAYEEDFGFVRRDAKILERAASGEKEGQVDNRSGSGAGEDEPDATSGDPAADRTRSDSTGTDGDHGGRKVGLLKENIDRDKFGAVYDASKAIAGEPQPARGQGDGREPRYSVVTTPRASVAPARMSKAKAPERRAEDADDVSLPQSFQVKYLGHRDASGLWGIKHTRKPVDLLVKAAKSLESGTVLPIVRLLVSKEGVSVLPLGKSQEALRFHAIDTISYGVQDLVYTRVFCIIVVRETATEGPAQGRHPFECHAFVCDSRHGARKLTYSLSAAFKEFSKSVKASGDKAAVVAIKKKFAIDLRSPEEIEEDLKGIEDSEA